VRFARAEHTNDIEAIRTDAGSGRVLRGIVESMTPDSAGKCGWAFSVVLLAIGCGGSRASDGGSRARDGGSSPPDGGSNAPDASVVVPDGTCLFAGMGDPSSLPGTEEIINVLSERLSAPSGGLWWLAEPLEVATVVARDESGGAIELDVVKRAPFDADVPFAPLATIRVPQALPAGARLTLGTRQLVVEEPVERLALDQVTVSFSHRPELGGTGVTVSLPSAWRSRVFAKDGYVALGDANVVTGIQVIEELLLADAPRLCGVSVPAEAGEVFVPMWRGQIKPVEELSLVLRDADDFANTKVVRLQSSD
jgi:hypothetical protein